MVASATIHELLLFPFESVKGGFKRQVQQYKNQP